MMNTVVINKIINRAIRQFMAKKVVTADYTIFLTFDDGPEPGITEFVLGALKK